MGSSPAAERILNYHFKIAINSNHSIHPDNPRVGNEKCRYIMEILYFFIRQLLQCTSQLNLKRRNGRFLSASGVVAFAVGLEQADFDCPGPFAVDGRHFGQHDGHVIFFHRPL